MASGLIDQSESEDASSDTTDSSSTTSVESTTSDSETTTSLHENGDGDFLHDILQDLSLSLDTTHTGGTDNASKKSAKKSSDDLGSRSNSTNKSEPESIDNAQVPKKAERAIKNGSETTSDDSETEEETEQEHSDETEQVEADQDDAEEKDKTEETEDTIEGDNASASELDAELMIQLLRETAGPEPDVIAPPFRSKTTKPPSQSRTTKDKAVKQEHQLALPAANPLFDTIQCSLFNNFFRCTNSNILDDVDEKRKEEEASAVDPSDAVTTEREKDEVESAAKETKDAPSTTAVDESPQLETDAKMSKIDITADGSKGAGVDSVPEEGSPQVNPEKTADPVLLTNDAPNEAVPPEACTLPSPRSTEARNSFKQSLQVLKQTYSMPLSLSLSLTKSGEWSKNDTLRTVCSHDTGLATTDMKSSRKKLPTVSPASNGRSKVPGKDALSEPLANDVFKMLQSVNEDVETEGETADEGTKMPSSPDSTEDTTTEAITDEEPTATELSPGVKDDDEEEATQRDVVAGMNTSGDINDAIISQAPSQPVARLAHRLRSWTGKKTKRKKGGRREMPLDDSVGLGENTLNKPRRRRKKSKFLRSLTRYVRTKATLPVISEDESEDSATVKEKDFAYQSEVEACLTEVEACLSGLEGNTAGQPVTSNDIESEKNAGNGDTCASDEMAEEREIVERSDSSEKAATAPMEGKSQPSSSSLYQDKESATCQTEVPAKSDERDTAKSEADEFTKGDASVNEPTAETLDVTNGSKSIDTVEEEDADTEDTSSSHSLQSEPREMALKSNYSQDKHSQRDTVNIEEKLRGPTRSIKESESRTSHLATELTWETHQDIFENKSEGHPHFSKAEIEEEEDGFSIIIKASSCSGGIDGAEEDKAEEISLESRQRDVPKENKKSVPGRLDLLEKKPTRVEGKKASSKKEQQASTPVASVTEQSQPYQKAKKWKHKHGRKVFARSTSFLKSIKGGAHGKRESQEVREQPPGQDLEEVAAVFLPQDLVELQRWDSVEEKINASLKKVQCLASHYGEDVHHLLEQNNSRVTIGSVESVESVEFARSASPSFPDSASQEWRVVEERIDESLLKVERLANRLGVSRDFLSSE